MLKRDKIEVRYALFLLAQPDLDVVNSICLSEVGLSRLATMIYASSVGLVCKATGYQVRVKQRRS